MPPTPSDCSTQKTPAFSPSRRSFVLSRRPCRGYSDVGFASFSGRSWPWRERRAVLSRARSGFADAPNWHFGCSENNPRSAFEDVKARIPVSLMTIYKIMLSVELSATFLAFQRAEIALVLQMSSLFQQDGNDWRNSVRKTVLTRCPGDI